MFTNILIEVLSSIIGMSSASLAIFFEKSKLLKQDRIHAKNLTDKINELTASLSKSAQLMAEIEDEFARQKELAEKWKSEAETSQLVASLNQKEVEAITKIFGNKIEIENKKSGRASIFWGALFCLIGLAGGFLLSKYFL